MYKTPYGKVLKGWRKQLKYKKFKFCGIQHKHYSIGLAIADIGWVGHGFFYIYDHETGQVIEWNAIQPLGHKTYLDEQPLFNQSYFSKSPYQFDIQHANGVRYIRVTKYGEICLRGGGGGVWGGLFAPPKPPKKFLPRPKYYKKFFIILKTLFFVIRPGKKPIFFDSRFIFSPPPRAGVFIGQIFPAYYYEKMPGGVGGGLVGGEYSGPGGVWGKPGFFYNVGCSRAAGAAPPPPPPPPYVSTLVKNTRLSMLISTNFSKRSEIVPQISNQ
ncbi:DUF2804 family protein [Klebsiella pneumoniae]